MLWLDEIWVEPTEEDLLKLELELGEDFYDDSEKFNVVVTKKDIILSFTDGPKETYQLNELGLDSLSREELKREVESRLGKNNINKILIIGGNY